MKKWAYQVQWYALNLLTYNSRIKFINKICNIIGDKGDDDGFTHRLLLHAPPDECRDAKTIMQARVPLVKLHNIFLFIHLTHMVNRRYEFSEEADKLLMAEFDKYQLLKQRAKRCDYGLL